MEHSIPIYKQYDNFRITKTSYLSSSRSRSSILNLILVFLLGIFTLCSIHYYVRQEKEMTIILTNTSSPIAHILENDISILRKTSYYDYEPYLNNTSDGTRTRRFYYIDLGCFDGRDIDYFLHFHLQEILLVGNLSIIAFEPDPINYSACKLKHKLPMSLTKTVHNVAVWTENGKVQYATERGQKSKIDTHSVLSVSSIDFSQWLLDNFSPDDYVYVKFTVEGVEVPILEKMIIDNSLLLVDYLEVEWNHYVSHDLEPRRVALECMFDNFGMDFLYIINPVDVKYAYNVNDTYSRVPKDRTWKLTHSLSRFHYKTRKDVPILLAERLKRREELLASS